MTKRLNGENNNAQESKGVRGSQVRDRSQRQVRVKVGVKTSQLYKKGETMEYRHIGAQDRSQVI